MAEKCWLLPTAATNRDAENRNHRPFVKQIPPGSRGFFSCAPGAGNPMKMPELFRIHVFFAFPKNFEGLIEDP